jgi:dihydroneopterin aldolase
VDRIVIPRIPLEARLGVTDAEREAPQEITVDLVLHRELGSAGASDDLADTIDYDAVCATVGEVVAARPYRLIEAVAEELARALLARFGAAEVEVRVEKPGALRARGVPFAAVEIRRHRDG